MKMIKHIKSNPFEVLLLWILALFLVLGTAACDSQQQSAEAPEVAEAPPAEPASTPESAPAPATEPEQVHAAAPIPAPAAETAEATAPKPEPVVLPAGSRLFVTMDSTLDSRKHGMGHMFTVTLDSNLAMGGNTLAPKGTKLYGKTTSAKKGGALAGKSEIDLQLTDIMINNVPHPIVTSGIKAITENKAGSTVATTAGAAAVGGLAGGSKGAKRGAAVGLGLSMLSGGKSITISQGTLLEFILESEFTYVP